MANTIPFKAQRLKKRIYRVITDNRIITESTVNALGKHCKSTVLVINYGLQKRAIFILGKRIK